MPAKRHPRHDKYVFGASGRERDVWRGYKYGAAFGSDDERSMSVLRATAGDTETSHTDIVGVPRQKSNCFEI
jgi:hypothetical protein